MPRATEGAMRLWSKLGLRSSCGRLLLHRDSALRRLAAIRRLSYVRLVTRFTSKQVQDALALIYVAHPAGNAACLVDQVIEALVGMVPGELVGYNERELVSH